MARWKASNAATMRPDSRRTKMIAWFHLHLQNLNRANFDVTPQDMLAGRQVELYQI